MEKKLMSGRTTTSPTLYKELYRTYYRENWKAARIILTVISIPFFLYAIELYNAGKNNIDMAIVLWVALVLVIYPRNAFRRAYKKVQNDVVSVHFTFYGNEMKEKTGGKATVYAYDSILRVIDAPGYFYFFHTKRDVSVLEKDGIIDGTPEELSELLKSKVKKYKVKK